MKQKMLAAVGSKTRFQFGRLNDTQEPAKATVSKEALYGFGVIPVGLLDHPIFKGCESKFEGLYALFQRIKPLLSTLHLDHEHVWPLVALMGMEDALDELLAANPTARDDTGRDALIYLTIGGHREVLQRRIARHYPDFDWKMHTRLLDDAALVYGDQGMLDFLMKTYGFRLWQPEYPETGLPALYRVVSCGFTSMFWELVEELGQSGVVDLHESKSLPLLAATNKRWELCDDLISRGFELTQQVKGLLVFCAARDSKERFLELLKRYNDIDFRVFSVDGNNVYTSACSGGNVEVVDYLLNLGWFSETAPDWSKSRATGLQIAVAGGHTPLVQYFFTKFGPALADQKDPEGRDIFDYAAMLGDWDYFLELAKIYRPKNWVPSIRAVDNKTPLDCALVEGNLYFAQQFVAKYGSHYLHNYKAVTVAAIQSGNPYMKAWVSQQVQALSSQEDERLVEDMFSGRPGSSQGI